jgi:hypothetical protein
MAVQRRFCKTVPWLRACKLVQSRSYISADQFAQIALGILLIAVYFLFPGKARWAVLSLAISFVAPTTGFISTCPVKP